MKYCTLLFLLLPLISSCGHKAEGASPTELAISASKGRSEANAALALPAGSMEREDAILAIRARETQMRMAGFEQCADTFAAAAREVLSEDPDFFI